MGLVEERHHNYVVDTKKSNKQNIWIPNAKNKTKTHPKLDTMVLAPGCFSEMNGNFRREWSTQMVFYRALLEHIKLGWGHLD